MKKITTLFLAVLVIVTLVGATGCQYQSASPTTNNTSTAGTQQTGSQTVAISNFSFVPSQITITKGATITWTNNDSAPHQIVADDNSFQSGALSQGQSFQQTFDQEGTYSYHCAIHPSMKGTVIVTK